MRGKVTPTHLDKRAYVYVRQSTMAQVFENAESQARQYGLADRARGLGWAAQAVEVIDEDLGKSGASTEGRTGFARLARAVAFGQAGAIFALDISRLARSSYDWQRLLRLCAVGNVLVIDESCVYDPGDKDDKLLLDLKGTMYEAELNWLSLRLAGSRRNKAQRGELHLQPPTGYLWGTDGYELDPDESVRAALAAVFSRFEVEPSAWAVVRWARRTGLRVPKRIYEVGGTKLVWQPLTITRLCSLLHNPVYAGAYVYGRLRAAEALVEGEIRRARRSTGGPDDWLVRIEDAHPGYISWETYVKNQETMRQNRTRPEARGAPRDGQALLGGLLVCGRCGRPMKATYWGTDSRQWSYGCPGERAEGGSTCWSVVGWRIDEAVEAMFLAAMVPPELELSLAVEQQVREQAAGLERQWSLRIERAEYDARLAERRYMAVDPDNRVVARTLERAWEESLRELEDVRRQYEDARRTHHVDLSERDRARIREMAADLPAVWRAPTTSMADRKAMLRLAVEVVVLHPIEVPRRQIRAVVRWQGGAESERTLPWPTRKEWGRTPEDAAARIRELAAAGVRDEQIAEHLNAKGIETGAGRPWNLWAVRWARHQNGIRQTAPAKPRALPVADRHVDGRYSFPGAAEAFGLSESTVRRWATRGLVEASREDDGHNRRVWWLCLDEELVTRLVREAGPRTPEKPALPDRRPDGAWSIPGLARRFDISEEAVRGLHQRGRITGCQGDHGPYRGAWWFVLDETAEQTLRETAERAARRRSTRTPSDDNPS